MSQWSTYGLQDPLVPFDEGRLDALASVLKAGSDDSKAVVNRMIHLTGDSGRLSWSGLAADAFFEAIGDMPEDLGKLIRSYGTGYTVVTNYSAELKRLRSDADAHLEVINSHEWTINSLQFRLAAVPLEDEAQRRDLEREIASHEEDVRSMVRGGRRIQDALDDAAGAFKSAMWIAQDLGIHNRAWYIRVYQDHIEIWVESFVDAWDQIGAWVHVAAYVCMFVPLPGFRLAGLALLSLHRTIGAVALTLKTVDILLSDDDADFAYFVDAGLAVIGVGAKHTKAAYGTVTTVGRFANEVETFVDAVELADSTATIMDQVDNYVSGAAQQFEDVVWSGGRPGLSPFVTTPTLIDIDVDITIRIDL